METVDRISSVEDAGLRHQRVIRHLLHREMDLTAKCKDLQNRSRWNNLGIYRIPEGNEGQDMKAFVKDLIKLVLPLKPDINIQMEGAHHSLAPKPKNPSPRSLIVKFLDYSVKETVRRLTWSQRDIIYKL